MSEKRRDSRGRILRNGEGQRADGMYMFRYTDNNGKRKTIYSWKLVSTDKAPEGKRCKEALRDMERVIQRDLEDDIRTDDAASLTVNDLYKKFLELRTDLKETTRCSYICLYNKHVRESMGCRKLKSVKYSDVQKLYVEMIQDKKLKMSTVQSLHCLMYQMFNLAVMDNIIRTNPAGNVMSGMRKMFSPEQGKRHALTEDEQSRFIDFVYKHKVYKRWGNLFTVLLGTGMRIGEALGLRWCDCDFEQNTISVNHTLQYKESEGGGGYEYRISKPKTKAGIRTIPMFSDVRSALQREHNKKRLPTLEPFVVDGFTDFIFLNGNGKVFTPGAVFDTIQEIVSAYNRSEEDAAKEEGREAQKLPRFSAHILRHTFCTRLCENEPNIKVVQDVMGHKNFKTTMDVYNEATEVKKQASFQSLEGKIKLA